MDQLSQYLIRPQLRLRNGRTIATIAEAAAYVREHELRPGVDARDEILHQLERAQSKEQGEAAAEAFLSWLEGLDLIEAPPVVPSSNFENPENKAQETDIPKSAGASSDATRKSALATQTAVGADYLTGIANSLRRASLHFETPMPNAGEYVDKAASQLENFADTLRARDPAELVNEVRNFARREPAVVVCGAVIAGFAIVRFLKSSPDRSA